MIPVVIFSLTVHEYSHGRVAFLLGDNTAKRLGRLSFNPLKHLDPIGTLFFYFMPRIKENLYNLTHRKNKKTITHSTIWQ